MQEVARTKYNGFPDTEERFYLLMLSSNYSLHSVLCCITFRCAAEWLDNYVHTKFSPNTSSSHSKKHMHPYAPTKL